MIPLHDMNVTFWIRVDEAMSLRHGRRLMPTLARRP